MTRIRSIKPEFWTDSALVACSPLARLLFIGIWNHADDYGVIKDDPEQLRRSILPEDKASGRALVDELISQRLVVPMTSEDGTDVLAVRTWERHQKVDKRSPGKYGQPSAFTDRSPIPPKPARSRPIPPNPHPGREGKGEDLLPSGDGGKKPRKPDALWDTVMDVCGVTTAEIPPRELSNYGRVVSNLRAVDATPDEVRRRANAYRAKYPDADLTANALSKHWPALNGAAPTPKLNLDGAPSL